MAAPDPTPRLPAIVPLLGALVPAFGLLALALVFPLAVLAEVRHIDLGKLTNHHPLGAALSVPLLGLWWLAFAFAWRGLFTAGSVVRRLVWTLVVVQLVSAVLVYPLTAADVFDYIGHAQVLSVAGANPFTTPAERVPWIPAARLMAFPEMPTVYGPLWLVLSLLPAVADSLTKAAFLHKVGAAVALVLCAAGTAQLARRAGLAAGPAAFAVIASPLAMWEVGVNAHNDIWMMTVAVWAFVAWTAGRPVSGVAGVAGVVGSALIKFVSGVLLAPLAVDALRRGRRGVRAFAVGLLIGGIAALVAWWPFWAGGAGATVLFNRGGFLTTSLPGVILWNADPLTAGAWLPPVQTVLVGSFGVAAVCILVAQLRGVLSLERSAGWLFVALLGLGTFWYQPWYLLWVVPFAVVSRDRLLATVTWTLAVSAMATYGLFQYWPLFRELGFAFGYAQVLAWLTAWGPAVVVLGWSLVQRLVSARTRSLDILRA